MSNFFLGMIVIIGALALIILFFPFKFKLSFELSENGFFALFNLFKKKIWNYEKSWKKNEEKQDEETFEKENAVEPSYIATAPSVSKENKNSIEKKESPSINESSPGSASLNCVADHEVTTNHSANDNAALNSDKTSDVAVTNTAKENKKQKRKLTSLEFWSIILAPELDEKGFCYLKKTLNFFCKLFHIRFENCFVEGIRADYKTMGYGAAANAFIKDFPYLGAWDFRMDWCKEKELRAEGNIFAIINLCRLLGFLSLFVFYAVVLLFSFWRLRRLFFKTGNLPELGFIRKKILGWIVED